MTCKDCIHYDVCNAHAKELEAEGYNVEFDITNDAEKDCEDFKDKTRYIEMPCKFGDIVYQTDGVKIYESTIKNVIYETESIAFDERAIGQSIFLTREEAEKHLN